METSEKDNYLAGPQKDHFQQAQIIKPWRQTTGHRTVTALLHQRME